MKNKRVLSLLLSVLLLALCCVPAFAGTPAEDRHLAFREDGGFTILNFSDLQDNAILSSKTKTFIRKTVRNVDPDLIVLTGDNIAGYSAKARFETTAAIRQVMDEFELLGVPVAFVFGNHDDDGTAMTKEEEMAIYRQYPVCIAFDEGDALYGCGTYNVPILSSKGDGKVAFNLWMIDSGSYDEERGGYDYVHEDQIRWYQETSARLERENGGKVPSIAFQHIIVREIYDALEQTTADNAEVESGGKYYKLPDSAAPGSILGEAPCPGTYNAGEFAAMRDGGDVLAIVSGHDHVNAFVVPYQGVDLVNTPTCGFHSYGDNATRGARVIRLDENDPWTYETEIVSLEQTLSEDPLDRAFLKVRDVIDSVINFFKDLGLKLKDLFTAGS